MSGDSIRTRLTWGLAFLCTAVILGIILNCAANSLNSDKAYAENLIRLHVVANSNLPQDQDLKLAVRDEVLKEAERILSAADSKQGAYALLETYQERLRERAQAVVASAGFDYPVEVKMGRLFSYRSTEPWLCLKDGMMRCVLKSALHKATTGGACCFPPVPGGIRG